MSIDKLDPPKEESEESMGSSPEAEAPATATPQENQQPKRKGGRKPVGFSHCSWQLSPCGKKEKEKRKFLTQLIDLCDL